MATHLAFLRAINLGRNRKFPKADILRVVGEAGFTEAETHINTGNVRLNTSMRSIRRIEEALERAFLADRGFEVPTIVFRPSEFAEIVRVGAEVAAGNEGMTRHYVELLRDEMPPADARAAEALSSGDNRIVARGRAIHVLLGPDAQPGAAVPAAVARRIGTSTNRNFNVVRTIAHKWC